MRACTADCSESIAFSRTSGEQVVMAGTATQQWLWVADVQLQTEVSVYGWAGRLQAGQLQAEDSAVEVQYSWECGDPTLGSCCDKAVVLLCDFSTEACGLPETLRAGCSSARRPSRPPIAFQIVATG